MIYLNMPEICKFVKEWYKPWADAGPTLGPYLAWHADLRSGVRFTRGLSLRPFNKYRIGTLIGATEFLCGTGTILSSGHLADIAPISLSVYWTN